jgi:ABC-type branched-subunit amino acid transport system ATPase component
MTTPLLSIRGLRVRVADREVLKGIDLDIPAGEVHAIMGPNGSGKSSLAHVLAGRPGYTVLGGTVSYQGRDLLALPPEERAREGVFLGFQYPVEIPGVNNAYLLRAALNAARLALRIHRGAHEGHHRHARNLDRILEGQEQPGRRARCRLQRQNGRADQRRAAARDRIAFAAGQHIGERGLARAVRAHDGVHFAGGNGQ